MSTLAERTARGMPFKSYLASDGKWMAWIDGEGVGKKPHVWNPEHDANQLDMLFRRLIEEGFRLVITWHRLFLQVSLSHPDGRTVSIGSDDGVSELGTAGCLAFLRAKDSE